MTCPPLITVVATGSAVQPPPVKVTVGAEVYPLPGLVMLTLLTHSPVAPLPRVKAGSAELLIPGPCCQEGRR